MHFEKPVLVFNASTISQFDPNGLLYEPENLKN